MPRYSLSSGIEEDTSALPSSMSSVRHAVRRGERRGVRSCRRHEYARVRGSNAYKLLKIGPLFNPTGRFDTGRIPTGYRDPSRRPRLHLFHRSMTAVPFVLVASENATICGQFSSSSSVTSLLFLFCRIISMIVGAIEAGGLRRLIGGSPMLS